MAIFGGLGYLIYQNGGIPEDYEIVRNIEKIDSYSGQRLALSHSLQYHIDRPEYHQHYNDGGKDYVTALTGITDFGNIIGASASHNSSNFDGAYLEVLIEFTPETDTLAVAEQIKEFFVPSDYSLGADEYNAYFDDLTKDDFFVQAKDNYIFLVLIDSDLIGIRKSIEPEKLIDTFCKIQFE